MLSFPPIITVFRITDHAKFEMSRRGISEEEIADVLGSPEQIEPVRPGRATYQAKQRGQASAIHLLRVFVDYDREPAEVVSAYRTSKLKKYWRTP